MVLISGQNLTLGYEGQAVVSGLNFTVSEGDYLCIVGENGSGKSTLIKTLLGLIAPISGEVRHGDHLSAGEIGYLPQQTPIQRDFPASVDEVVLSGCQGRCGLRPFYNKQEKALARANMERMGILPLRGRCYRELSGGQQQRVLLARALCAAGKLLLLDEPVAGLDPKVTAELYELIRGLNEEGITIIMVSHDIQEALKDATHILHIGNRLFFGTKEEYLQSAAGMLFLGGREAQEPREDIWERPRGDGALQEDGRGCQEKNGMSQEDGGQRPEEDGALQEDDREYMEEDGTSREGGERA